MVFAKILLAREVFFIKTQINKNHKALTGRKHTALEKEIFLYVIRMIKVQTIFYHYDHKKERERGRGGEGNKNEAMAVNSTNDSPFVTLLKRVRVLTLPIK